MSDGSELALGECGSAMCPGPGTCTKIVDQGGDAYGTCE
jgi:hypothetical protein